MRARARLIVLMRPRGLPDLAPMSRSCTSTKVRAGMSRDEVRRLLGAPGEITTFDARSEEVWSWRYQEQNAMFFNVLFDRAAGTVRTTLRLEEILLMDTDC